MAHGPTPHLQHRVQALGGAGVPGRRDSQRTLPAPRRLPEPHPHLGREVRSGRLRRRVPGSGPAPAVRGEDRSTETLGRTPGVGDRVPKGGSKKHSVAEKRAYVRRGRPRGMSVAEGCGLMGLPRSTYYDAPIVQSLPGLGGQTQRDERTAREDAPARPKEGRPKAVALGPCAWLSYNGRRRRWVLGTDCAVGGRLCDGGR